MEIFLGKCEIYIQLSHIQHIYVIKITVSKLLIADRYLIQDQLEKNQIKSEWHVHFEAVQTDVYL